MTIWPDDMILTEAHAAELMARGACSTARRYIGVTVGEAARAKPWAALLHAADLLSPEMLDACARAEPWPALRYAADRLSPETLDYCGEQTR